MPTVLRQSGFAFMIYTDDHRPMHVHVWYQGRELVIDIEQDAHIRENFGMNRSQARQAVRLAEMNQGFLQKEWRKIHES